MFVILTVPDHYLVQHLWEHGEKTPAQEGYFSGQRLLCPLFIIWISWLDISSLIQDNLNMVLLMAVLAGIIHASGPHLLFVILYAWGTNYLCYPAG